MNETSIKTIFHHQFPFLSELDISHLWTIAAHRSFKNKETIIAKGQKADRLYFIINGTARGFFVEDRGEERTVFIRPEHTFFAAPEILQNQPYSKHTFEAIGQTAVVIFDFAKFVQMSQSNIAISRVTNRRGSIV